MEEPSAGIAPALDRSGRSGWLSPVKPANS